MSSSTAPTDASPVATTSAAAVVEERATFPLAQERFNPDVESLKDPAARGVRLDSVDLLRGLVMIIMALDHTRDFFHNATIHFDPTDLTQTNPALFFTRWITHFCAPVFVFLAGTGAYLSLGRGRTKKDLSWFLLTRGLWLVVLEVTLVRLAWTFDFTTPFVFVQVIWALGWSMVVLAALIHLPVRVIAGFGLLLIVGHNLLDRIHVTSFGGVGQVLWLVLHEAGQVGNIQRFLFDVRYPLIPWVGVMAAGYAFGRLLQLPAERRRKTLFRLGLGLTLAFIVIRATNLYGDPRMWAVQARAPIYTVLSFLNCEKYPPSLLYLLMTLGPAIMLLPLLERWRGALARFVMTFGRVPLFYYVLHLLLIHGLAVVVNIARYGRNVGSIFANGPPPDFGFNLLTVYVVWLVAVLLLYPPCRWWARLKQRNRSAWLSYL